MTEFRIRLELLDVALLYDGTTSTVVHTPADEDGNCEAWTEDPRQFDAWRRALDQAGRPWTRIQ